VAILICGWGCGYVVMDGWRMCDLWIYGFQWYGAGWGADGGSCGGYVGLPFPGSFFAGLWSW